MDPNALPPDSRAAGSIAYPAEPTPSLPAHPAGPATRKDRLVTLDAARGLALLGIFAVNVQIFGDAFGTFMKPTPPAGESPLGVALFYAVRVLYEGKFYPLFSMLFGMGLVLQMGRVAPGAFTGIYARRLGVLLAIGFLHATLLWAGDILFTYAIAGFVLLLGARLSGKALLAIGAGLVLFVATVCGSCWGGMMAMSERAIETELAAASHANTDAAAAPGDHPEPLDDGDPTTPLTDPTPTGPDHASAFSQLMDGLADGSIIDGPTDPTWIALERQAMGEGPWLDAFRFNLLNWAMSLAASGLSYGWHVLGLFFLGAGLMKLGIFQAGNVQGAAWRRRLIPIGFGLGFPGAIAAAALPALSPTTGGYIGGTILLYLSGPLVAIGYLCSIWRISEWGAGSAIISTLTAALARVGRMALTNYLLHTLIFTSIFHWWGLGLFGELSRPQRLALVPLVYLVLCATSWMWLRTFRMGPLEWLWRSLTYWKRQPIRNAPGQIAQDPTA